MRGEREGRKKNMEEGCDNCVEGISEEHGPCPYCESCEDMGCRKCNYGGDKELESLRANIEAQAEEIKRLKIINDSAGKVAMESISRLEADLLEERERIESLYVRHEIKINEALAEFYRAEKAEARVEELEKAVATGKEAKSDEIKYSNRLCTKVEELEKNLNSETARANFLEQKAADNRLAQKKAEARVEEQAKELQAIRSAIQSMGKHMADRDTQLSQDMKAQWRWVVKTALQGRGED